MLYLFAVQDPNQGEDHHSPCLLSNPLIHSMYFVCMYVIMKFLINKIKPNFTWSLHGKVERKYVSNGLGHMTKMAATTIFGKNL